MKLWAGAVGVVGLACGFLGPDSKTSRKARMIVVGGGVSGYLSPCGCTYPMSGGIRRWAAQVRARWAVRLEPSFSRTAALWPATALRIGIWPRRLPRHWERSTSLRSISYDFRGPAWRRARSCWYASEIQPNAKFLSSAPDGSRDRGDARTSRRVPSHRSAHRHLLLCLAQWPDRPSASDAAMRLAKRAIRN